MTEQMFCGILRSYSPVGSVPTKPNEEKNVMQNMQAAQPMRYYTEMERQIAEAVQKAKNGSRELKITYKADRMEREVPFLLGMAKLGYISLPTSNVFHIKCAGAPEPALNWQGEHKRSLVITLTDNFNEKYFVKAVRDALEKIEVA